MIDGTKYVVTESLTEVVDAVKAYRGELIAASAHVETGSMTTHSDPEPQERSDHVADTVRRLTAVPTAHHRNESSEA